MNENLYIKNLNNDTEILTIDKNKIFNFIKINNKKNIYNFNIKNLKNIYKNLFEYNKNNIKFNLLFASKNSNSSLLFNIIINDNNKYYILKKLKSEKLKKELINKKDINKIDFLKNKSYIFYFSYKNKNLCEIKLKDKKYHLKHYIKIPQIRTDIKEKNTLNCKLNNNIIHPIHEHILDCNSIKLKENNGLKHLKKCSILNHKYLIKPIPSQKKIIKNMIEKKLLITAGKIENKLNESENEINKRIENKEIKNKTSELKSIVDDSYKVILADTVNEFSSYLKENNINDKTHDVENLRRAYWNILEEIKEKNAEYKIIKEFQICKDEPVRTYCKVKNLISCQNICNDNHECRFVSYSNKNKICKLYDKCLLKQNHNYDTYIKRSNLRDKGYNIWNKILLSRNPIIPSRPFIYEVILVFFNIIIIIASVSILSRMIIAVIKFIYCFIYPEICEAPTEVIFGNDSNEKYI